MGRNMQITDRKEVCVVHGDPLNHFSWCDQFDYCEAGWAAGADYTCHSSKDCEDFGCGPHEIP